MPIHDLGYRAWGGPIHGAASRIGTIASTGCRLALKSTWVKRTLFFAWLPILFWGIGLYVGEQVLQGNRTDRRSEGRGAARRITDELREDAQMTAMARALKSQLGFMPGIDKFALAIQSEDPNETRIVTWRWLLMTFFRIPQSVAMVFLLGFVVPGLVSRDFRSRAFLMYFSRPIGRLEYVLGKLAIPAIFLVFISTLPALALYVTGLFLSPDLSVIGLTWDIPFRILFATAVVVLPTASLAIALSSLTHESRFASFAWFAVWMLGLGAWLAVAISRSVSAEMAGGDFENTFENFMNGEGMAGWNPISLYMSLADVQNWVFGFEEFSVVWPSALMLSVVTIGSLTLFWRRIGRSILS